LVYDGPINGNHYCINWVGYNHPFKWLTHVQPHSKTKNQLNKMNNLLDRINAEIMRIVAQQKDILVANNANSYEYLVTESAKTDWLVLQDIKARYEQLAMAYIKLEERYKNLSQLKTIMQPA